MTMARTKTGEGEARTRLLDAAGRGFRTSGFGGAGVDALAKGAGLTSGAFYAHFDSKAEAFRLAVADGLAFLRNGILSFRESHGRNWREPFIDFYLGPRMEVALDEACGLPSFSSDVARADDATRRVYEAELEKLVQALAEGFRGAQARERALALLAILSGAAAMARAVKDERLRREILNAANAAAKAI
jgi:TetR/AcrR family transcriptional regulator, transcriptional repressor for nem operon